VAGYIYASDITSTADVWQRVDHLLSNNGSSSTIGKTVSFKSSTTSASNATVFEDNGMLTGTTTRSPALFTRSFVVGHWATITTTLATPVNASANKDATTTSIHVTSAVWKSDVVVSNTFGNTYGTLTAGFGTTSFIPKWLAPDETSTGPNLVVRVATVCPFAGLRASTDTAMTGSRYLSATGSSLSAMSVSMSNVMLVSGQSVTLGGTMEADVISTSQQNTVTSGWKLAAGAVETSVAKSFWMQVSALSPLPGAIAITFRDATGGTTSQTLGGRDTLSFAGKVAIVEPLMARIVGSWTREYDGPSEAYITASMPRL
jgi:hypothetical protein